MACYTLYSRMRKSFAWYQRRLGQVLLARLKIDDNGGGQGETVHVNSAAFLRLHFNLLRQLIYYGVSI